MQQLNKIPQLFADLNLKPLHGIDVCQLYTMYLG